MQHKTKLFLFIFLLAGILCFAQTDIPPTPAVNGVPPPGTPIDGGLAILIAAGAYYGIKKSLKQ